MHYRVEISQVSLGRGNVAKKGEDVTVDMFLGGKTRVNQLVDKGYLKPLTKADTTSGKPKKEEPVSEPEKPKVPQIPASTVASTAPEPEKESETTDVRKDLLERISLGFWPGELTPAEQKLVADADLTLDYNNFSDVKLDEIKDHLKDWGGEPTDEMRTKKPVLDLLQEQMKGWQQVVRDGLSE